MEEEQLQSAHAREPERWPHVAAIGGARRVCVRPGWKFAILSLSFVNFSILDLDPQIIDTDGLTSHRHGMT